MKHDYISMSDDELERLSEKRDAKGRLTDVEKRAKHNLWLRYHNEECGRKCASYVTLDFYDGDRGQMVRRKLKGLGRVIKAINRYHGDRATIRLMYNMETDEVKYTILPPNLPLCERKEGDIIRFDYQYPISFPVNRESANSNIRIACNWIEFFESREKK